MEAQLNPTTECSALGSIFHFFLLAFTFWTCASSANMWWCICYPTRASSLFVETTKVHLLQSLVCWLVPAVCVAVNLGVQGGYSNLAEGSYSICMPSTRELAVVTFATPIVAASVFTVFLLFHTVYCLQKVLCLSSLYVTNLMLLLHSKVVFARRWQRHLARNLLTDAARPRTSNR
eukprot:m.90656 g.90656  ORF g.90656 m.90656 type:complete len:176 (+) comp36660_c0_seq25:966-1493(+)